MTRNNSHDPLARAASTPPSLFTQPKSELSLAGRADQSHATFSKALEGIDWAIKTHLEVIAAKSPARSLDTQVLISKAEEVKPLLKELRILSAKLRNALLQQEGGGR